MGGEKTLYLRGLPEGVVRAAKVEAARRGVTVARFVADAIQSQVRGPESDVELPEGLRADAAWYEENKRRLLKRYPGEYLAIVGRKVFDHGHDFSDLSSRVFARLGPRPVFMPRCTDSEEVVRVRGPRVGPS